MAVFEGYAAELNFGVMTARKARIAVNVVVSAWENTLCHDNWPALSKNAPPVSKIHVVR